MKPTDLKDLENLVKLCRKLGIDAIEMEGLKLNLGPAPYKAPKKRAKKTEVIPEFTAGNITEDTRIVIDKIATDELTDEQLLFYSAQGHEPVENQ